MIVVASIYFASNVATHRATAAALRSLSAATFARRRFNSFSVVLELWSNFAHSATLRIMRSESFVCFIASSLVPMSAIYTTHPTLFNKKAGRIEKRFPQPPDSRIFPRMDQNIIARRLAELGITQAALADAVGVTTETIRRWADGTNAPNAKYLPKLSDVLHVTIEALVRGLAA